MKPDVRKVLLQELSDIKDNKVALLLSGGLDSTSLLFALKELGKDVIAYTFTLRDRESQDFRCAKEVCRKFNTPFVPIYLPIDIDRLKKVTLYLINNLGLQKKVDIECTWAMLYSIKKVQERVIVAGLGADGHFCVSKKGKLHYAHSLESIEEFRKNLFSNPNYAQKVTCEQICGLCGKEIITPYITQSMINEFKGTRWEEINKPHQKQPIIDAYPNEFAKIRKRDHVNFQLGDSGIAELFEELLKTDWNLREFKSVRSIYNAIIRGEITG